MKRLVMIAFLLVGCGDDDGGADAATDTGADVPEIDAPTADVPMVDAPAADVPMVDAGPTHCGDTLVISDYDPMATITLYNPTAEAIDLTGTGWVLCQRMNYFLLEVIEPGVTIAANGTHTFDLPAAFSDQDDAGGEVALYEVSAFADPSAMRDFVCWGTGRSESRLSVAEAAGLWSGDCADAITGDSLKRLADTSGTEAASYDATGAAADLSCP